MKELINKLNKFYKAAVKKFNNYRLTSVILSATSLVAGVVSLGLLFIYYFAFPVWEKTNAHVPSFMQLGADQTQIYGKVMGMIFFLCMIAVIGLSIAVVYNLLPAIRNKEKVAPKKSPLMFAFISGVLEIAIFIFTILAVTIDKNFNEAGELVAARPDTFALYIVTMPFILATSLVNLLAIVPFLKCSFYQPAIGTKLCPKKQAEEEAK